MDLRTRGDSEELLQSTVCGCFYCCENYSPQAIDEWTDENQNDVGTTAICPRCGIGSVLGDASGLELSRLFLATSGDTGFEETESTQPAAAAERQQRYAKMSDPREKKFRLRADQIEPLATGLGACFATDMITVDGLKVAFMYRERPDRDIDSGWRFMSGFESDEYMSNPDNHAIYDVNTIANYDRDILPHLDAPVGSAFERKNGTGPFIQVYDFFPPDEPV